MHKWLILFSLIVLLTSCQSNLQESSLGGTPRVLESALTVETPAWSVYDPDPEHLWNRVFRQLYERRAANGEVYGAEELDPLLWFDTTYLLAGDSHQKALEVLDDFLASDAERLIQDPLKRAMFQRDLWAVFDWAASQAEPHPVERDALKVRLAEIMRRVALSRAEILSLPDNFAAAVESRIYPAAFQAGQPEAAFLPPDLFQPESAWVQVGRQGGPVAMTHTEAFPFFGRSAFLVFLRSPDGREATLDFIELLSTSTVRVPVTPIGSQVALVRRMFLIDDQDEPVLSSLVETIQLRHFSPAQSFYEFELSRMHLFEGIAGGLVPNDDLFMLFMGHGDVFQHDIPDVQAGIPELCRACHFEHPSIPNSGATHSIITSSRQPFSLPGNEKPVLLATTIADEAQTVIAWKQHHETWRALEALWE